MYNCTLPVKVGAYIIYTSPENNYDQKHPLYSTLKNVHGESKKDPPNGVLLYKYVKFYLFLSSNLNRF